MQLSFTDVGKLPPPVLQFADVTFGYSPDRVLYRNVSLHYLLLPQMVPAAPRSEHHICQRACMLAVPLEGIAWPVTRTICMHAATQATKTLQLARQSG